MWTHAIPAFVHFIAVFGIAATVVLEWTTLSRTPTLAEARRIQLADRWYGICAGVVLLAGFARAWYFEKGMAYYQGNLFFQLKLWLFLLMGLLSIYPTVRFIAWRKQTRQNLPPVVGEREFSRLRLALGTQLALLAMIVLCASLMAKGVGS